MIKGLDKLVRELKAAQRALDALNGELTTVSFDPESPESIDAAIKHVNQAIDQRVGTYASNDLVAPLIDEVKDHYRQQILDRAAAARLGDDGQNDEE